MVILMCQSSNSHAKADDVRRTYSLQMMVWPSTDDVRLWSLSFNGSLVDSNATEIIRDMRNPGFVFNLGLPCIRRVSIGTAGLYMIKGTGWTSKGLD